MSNVHTIWDHPREDAPQRQVPSVFTRGFEHRAIRKKFVRKVYALFSMQIVLMGAIISVCVFVSPIRYWMVDFDVFMYCSLAVSMIIFYALLCYKPMRRNVPVNYILLTILTISLSLFAAALSAVFFKYAVLASMGITLSVTIVMTIAAALPCLDVTGWVLYLCLGLTLLFSLGITISIVALFTDTKILTLVFSSLASIIFSLYLVYDTQLILGGRRYEIMQEEYILATVHLYIDFVLIFMSILGLFKR